MDSIVFLYCLSDRKIKKTIAAKSVSEPKKEEKIPAEELKDVLEAFGKGLGGLFK
tara:strand:+ start:205 stop:369 length:165 start_codon:yes stop_codon:yes gene_type:complete